MALMLVAAAALAVGAGGAEEPSFKTPPAWLKKPTGDQIKAVWPDGALQRGVEGRAVLNCRVDVGGLTEDCRVASETPAGMGFGAAALVLTPQFQFKPAMSDNGPVAARVNIPINFEKAQLGSNVILQSITVLRSPRWAQAPGFADVGAAYPRGAKGVPGYVAFSCGVKASGALTDCQVTREEPRLAGFAQAGYKLIPRFRVEMSPELAKSHAKLQVNLPIRFVHPASAAFAAREVGEPVWLVELDPQATTALFPAQAVAKGLRTGRGVAHCAVAADGVLHDCTPLAAEPEGLGFSEAAVKVAQVLRMNRWTQAGGPVDGVVNLPIRFYLAGQAPAPAAGAPGIGGEAHASSSMSQ